MFIITFVPSSSPVAASPAPFLRTYVFDVLSEEIRVIVSSS